MARRASVGNAGALDYHARSEAMMVHLRSVLVVLAIALGSVPAGCSQGTSPEAAPGPNGDGGLQAPEESAQEGQDIRWWQDEVVLAELRLTDEQRQELSQLMNEHLTGDAEQRQRERRLSIGYLRALAQEPYDPALVDRVSEQLIGVLAERSRRRIENLRDVRDVLTQEQWTRLWEVAPRALQIGRIRVVRGPRISITADPDETGSESP